MCGPNVGELPERRVDPPLRPLPLQRCRSAARHRLSRPSDSKRKNDRDDSRGSSFKKSKPAAAATATAVTSEPGRIIKIPKETWITISRPELLVEGYPPVAMLRRIPLLCGLSRECRLVTHQW
jgi:hypothetical protein